MTWKLENWPRAVCTLFGLGRVGSMPGTLAAIAAAIISVVIGGPSITILIALTAVGVLAADRFGRSAEYNRSEIVIDAAVGYLTAVCGLSLSDHVIAFFLFRLFAILKPFPVSLADRLPGGFGIMAGGLTAGAMVNVAIRAIRYFFFMGV